MENVETIGVDSTRNLQAWTLRDRQWRLTIRYTSDGIETMKTLGEPEESSNMALRISFQVERTDGTALNTASIKLWNLAKGTANMLMKEGVRVELRAGYGENLPLIFEGTVVQCFEQLSGSNRVYSIEAVDGFQELRNAFVSASFRRGTSFYAILTYIANVIGIPLIISNVDAQKLKDATIESAIAIHGTAKDALTELLNDTSLNWRISAGLLNVFVMNSAEAYENSAYVLTPLTGLIGLPERLFESSVTYTGSEITDMAYYMFGYRVQFFMNGALEVGDVVYLESSVITGLFTIYKMTVKGDNLGGDWTCTAELKEYSAQGE